MDNYHEMCEAAQLEWEPKVGDRFVVKQTLYLTSDFNFTTHKPKEHQIPYFVDETEYVLDDIEELFEQLKPFAIWLPTIEQVSEMFLDQLHALEPFIHGFFSFIFKRDFGSPIQNYSYRELHLMYYFYYFKNQLWIGQEFVEVEEGIDKKWGG